MQNKTLLAKIVGLVAVMCLALAMVFGLVGCGGKTVSKTSIENGHLIVTYSDNTTEDLGSVLGPQGPQGEQGKVNPCEHVNKFLMNRFTLEDYNWMVGNEEDEIEATGEDFCYFELYVCKDCGFVTVEFETEHEFGEPEVVEPTCEEEGYTGKVCTICGYAIDKEDTVPATGHNYETNYYTQYADANRSFCIDGGFVAAICTSCGDEQGEAVFVPGLGHQSLKWTITQDPTDTTEGTLTGVCEVCGKAQATRTLPILNKENYEYVLNNEERQVADVDKDYWAYSITIKFEEYTFDAETGAFVKSVRLNDEGEEIAQTFKFSQLQPHKSKGVDYIGHSYIDGYVLDMDDIKLFGNSGDLKCDAFIPAYFICDECGEAITLSVKKAHVPNAQGYYDVTEATCWGGGQNHDEAKDGVRYFDCANCNTTHIEEIIPKLDHDYKYTIQTIENSEKVNIIITCGRTYCQYQDTINNVEAVKVEIPATCEADGSITYSYKPAGAAEDSEPVKLVQVLPQLDHRFVDGEVEIVDDVEVYEIDVRLKDTVIYPYGQYNFTPFGNVEFSCGNSYDMYFTCADCGQPILVHVIKEHVKPAADQIEVVEATCTENGSMSYTCEECHQPVNEIILALGHNYEVVTYEPGTEENKYNVTIKCSVCPDQQSYTNADYSETITEGATCTAAGKKDISLTVKEGEAPNIVEKTYEVKDVVIPKLAHTYNGKDIDEVNAYPAGTAGLTITGNNPENCQGTGKGIIWCDVCKQPILVNVKGPHTIIADTLVNHPATCVDDAWREFDCALCQAVLGEEYEKIVEVEKGTKLGHDYKVEITLEPTATSTGAAKVTCTRCDFVENIELPKVIEGENYVIDPEAQCNAEGLGTYTVEVELQTVSDELGINKKVTVTFTKEIPTTSHHYVVGDYKIFTYTDDEDITWRYTAQRCADCDEYIITNIEKLDD